MNTPPAPNRSDILMLDWAAPDEQAVPREQPGLHYHIALPAARSSGGEGAMGSSALGGRFWWLTNSVHHAPSQRAVDTHPCLSDPWSWSRSTGQQSGFEGTLSHPSLKTWLSLKAPAPLLACSSVHTLSGSASEPRDAA